MRLCLARQSFWVRRSHCSLDNASHFARDTLADASYEGFLSINQVNLYAPMALSQVFAAQLPASLSGQIINLSDGVYGWSMSPHFLTYSL